MRTRALALTAAAAAASLVMTGTSMAAASPRHAASPAKRTGTEYIQEMSYSATSPNSQVIAYGLFTAAGVDTELSNTADRLSFPGGTFVATYKVSGARPHQDAGTCVSTVVLSITYNIGKGTGKFAGITGSGHATTTILNVAAPTTQGGCSATKEVAQQTLIDASGPVTLK